MKSYLHIRFLILSACAALLCACVREDAADGTDDGASVSLHMEFSAAEASAVTVSRAASATYSTIASLTLFIYDAEGRTLESAQDFTFDPQNDGSTLRSDNTRVYTLDDVQTTVGVKQMCAIANAADVSVWEYDELDELLAAAKAGAYTFDELQRQIVSLQSSITEEGSLPLFSATRMLLSGADRITVSRVGQTRSATADKPIQLRRAVAEITFNFTRSTNPYFEFSPTTYRIYNVPRGVRVGCDAETPFSENADDYFDTESFVAPPMSGNAYSFSFFMPENIQEPGRNSASYTDYATAYQERDAWDVEASGVGAGPAAKQWTNAPQYATFIVINGSFNQTDASGNLTHTGSVSYTIHLGDFSEKTGAMNNYSVERNYRYTYNIRIDGVDRIIAEAEKSLGDEVEQTGAEGGVINVTSETFDYTVDSHFEQVYLEYNLSDMADVIQVQDEDKIDEEIGQHLLMIVVTPYTTYGYCSPYSICVANPDNADEAKKEALKEIDYKWVEFYPQTAAETISSYPGRPSWKEQYGQNLTANSQYLLDVYDLCVALGKAVRKIKNGEMLAVNTRLSDCGNIYVVRNSAGKYVARFTAFVDEYYYMEHPFTGEDLESWGDFVNKDVRRMLVVVSVQGSDDGNSSSVNLYSNISQRSIQSFFDAAHSSQIDAFGVETFDETGRLSYGISSGDSNHQGTDQNNGYPNMLKIIGGSNASVDNETFNYGSWSTYVNSAKNGYMTTNTSTNPVASHRISGALQSKYNYAVYACMSRNRDLDGDGKISRDEIRWYMPATFEYVRIGIGAGAMASEAQLYFGDKAAMTYDDYGKGGYADKGQFYFTSHYASHVFWAVEKGAYGADEVSTSLVRCIRHLPKDNRSIIQEPEAFYVSAKTTDGNYLLDYRDRLQSVLMRPTRIEGYLVRHDEDSPYNTFYKGLVISKGYEGATYHLSDVTNQNGNTNACANYYEKSDRSDRGSWRVPNLVELLSMTSNVGKYLSENNQTPSGKIFCCTSFSNQDVRSGFGYDTEGLVFCTDPFSREQWLYNGYFQGRVRCVRDATDEELESAVRE